MCASSIGVPSRMYFKIFIFILVVFPGLLAQRGCSRDRMRQCLDGLRRNVQRRINDMNRMDMTAHCANVRDDFNCLLQETKCLTTDLERNSNGDALRNALKYIRDGCDTPGNTWRDSSCFVGEGMKTCESSYPLGGIQFTSYNPETCRKFNLFQDCVMDVVRNRCRPDDDRLLGQYLVDNGHDLAWNCGESTSTSDADRTRYDRDRTRDDRDRYDDRYNDRYNDRRDDRYRDRDRDRTQDSWRSNYGNVERGGNRDNDRYSDRYYPGGSGGYGGNAYSGSSGDITCCRNERCDRSRLQQCRDSLTRTIDSRMSGYQDSKTCRSARDNFNCLLWQTANCVSREEKDRDNDLFRRARDYISRNCDTYGRWSENSCFKTTEMQRCENSLSSTRGGANYEACRAYNSFKDCMTDELMRRCTREDELYQGAYLVDKAQEMAWQCVTDSYNGRNQYSTYDRNDRRDQYGAPYSGYEENPPHLEDEDARCYSRMDPYARQCKKTLDDKQRDLYTEENLDRREKIVCCSAREYRSCLYDATRRVCLSERSRVVDSLMGRYRLDLSKSSCRQLYDSDCNAGNPTYASLLLISACLIVLSALFSVRF
ncbi:uncharacterized protein LOC118191150 isoform X1 [Stegodyphus dumicola]|uniref:uncharacterized protein LOC118191150 isoform X1 n=1 Tax=Stegodyphus dumicola TaxID=202533 RepID=UPI0015AE8F94|nr:uncharacterized protein LOC118191150 isoform X1 [Stegodyphus dumicola]